MLAAESEASGGLTSRWRTHTQQTRAYRAVGWVFLLCNFNNALFGDVLCFVNIETIKIDDFFSVIDLIDVIENTPSDVPLDTDLHLLILLLTDSFLRPKSLALHEDLLRLCQPVITLHIVLHQYPLVPFFILLIFGASLTQPLHLISQLCLASLVLPFVISISGWWSGLQSFRLW